MYYIIKQKNVEQKKERHRDYKYQSRKIHNVSNILDTTSPFYVELMYNLKSIKH